MLPAQPDFEKLVNQLLGKSASNHGSAALSTAQPPDPATTLHALRTLAFPLKRCPIESVKQLVSFGSRAFQRGPLVSLFLEVLFQLFSKQKINFRSHEEQTEIIGQCIVYLLSIISSGTCVQPPATEEQRLDALRVLGSVLYENGGAMTKYHTQLLAALSVKDISGVSADKQAEAHRMSLACLGNMCVKTGAKGAALQKEVLDILMQSLTCDLNDEGTSKIVSSALRGIQLLVNENKTIVQDIVPDLLPILQRISLHTPAAAQNAPVVKPAARRQMTIPSDSELSEGEAGLPRNKQRDNRLQLNALLCLQALAKAQAKLVFPYWFRFLPDPVAGPAQPSLISVMRDSDSPKVRHGACAALMAFLDGAKQYLSVAEDSGTRLATSFTSLSVKLAEQLREIHDGVLNAVKEETWPLLLTQELKCLTILVKNCTYERLHPPYRQRAFEAAASRISSDDFAITSAAFECIAAVLDSGMTIPTSESEEHSMLAPVIAAVFTSLDKAEHISVRVAGLEVMCALARNQVQQFRPVWLRLVPLLSETMTDVKDVVRAASFKLVEQYAHSCSTTLIDDEAPSSDWWCDIVDNYVHRGIRDEFFAVRSLAVDCLGHIPAFVFGQMPAKRQYACLALALGMVQDEDPSVRAAACRTLGVYVGFPAVMEDVLFLSDVATTVPRLMSDANVGVRIRASWTLGNLTDALAHVSKNIQVEGQTISDAGIDTTIIVQIISAAILAAKDNDKCRSNGTRALGNIVRVCPPALIARETGRLMKDVLNVVLKNIESGTVKTRWNACHALQNILATPAFPLSAAGPARVFGTLTRSLLTCKNFKVRISAAAALTGPTQKASFGNLATVKAAMAACVTAAEGVEDLGGAEFGEFRYREQLAKQLKATFFHLYKIIGGVVPPLPAPVTGNDASPADATTCPPEKPVTSCSSDAITAASVSREPAPQLSPDDAAARKLAAEQSSADARDSEIQTMLERLLLVC
ncbi:HEAT repeat-containing protein 6 [Geranomyces michiganensis]|nr:HEAT repeat-containing protein 6 [Geranomyces michiganensis]